MHTLLRRASVVLAAFGIAGSACPAAADDAFIRASEDIVMSRNMDVKDRVDAADSLARNEPRAAVPILVKALNEVSEPVRRAAARGLWTIAQNDNPETAAAARAALPALRIALDDSSVSVAIDAAGALERLGYPATSLIEYRLYLLFSV
jgi:HEAT repeat protein